MKKALVAIALSAFATSAFAIIDGGPHDLNTISNPANAKASDCIYCHAPHAVNTSVSGTPLWNRNMFAGAFTTYSSTTVPAARVSAPGANSVTCLACHEGSLALGDLFASPPAEDVTTVPATLASVATANIGADLRNDHPIGVQYPGATVNFVGTPAGMVFYDSDGAGPGTNFVECGTCHNPHESTNVKFLRVSGDACTVCHIR